MPVNEFVTPGLTDSRISDTTELTNNETLLLRTFLAILGLDVNKNGEYVRRKMTVKDEHGKERVYATEMLMTYEGALRLVDTILMPYLSNLSSFTTLTDADIRRLSTDFGIELSLWLYANRERYELDRASIRILTSAWPDLVFLQLNRAKTGDANLMTQVMGNTQKQYVYRGDLDAQQYDVHAPKQQRSIWNLGGLLGGR